MKPLFDHERLTVYQAAIRFIVWTGPIIETLPKRAAVADQLDRASTSIPLNIAEGNGKYTAPDRCRKEQIAEGKTLLHEIVSMLFGLIRSNDRNRLAEDEADYQLNPQPL